ncbi:MAG: pirin family protein [Ignavibacteriae bacterium]|nr:MAG: pirin family protein [Ignavibacteriota bacterium]
MRNVRLITSSLHTTVGPLKVAQPLPTNALRYADPFLLLHHAGPQTIEAGSEVHKIEAHPHRGFDPVTFVYRGSVLHRDSLGNQGTIGPGEVQWIKSGSGILHEEGPTPDMARDGGELELIQLWINVPAAEKMDPPAYFEIHRDQVLHDELLDGRLTLDRVIAKSSVYAAMGHFSSGAIGKVDVTSQASHLLYILGGSVTINGEHRVEGKHLVIFDDTPGGFTFEAHSDGSLLLLGGDPIGEPMVQYGPFVMSTEDEIRDAFRDYAGGKFGSL